MVSASDRNVSIPFDVAKLEDVARKAGVSNATASRALSGAGKVSDTARRRILEAAKQLSYTPNRSAQALKGGRSGMIGMVVPNLSDLFFASCVNAVEAVAMRNSSLLVVAATHDRADRTVDAMKRLLDHRVDGLVLGCSEYLTPLLTRTLRALPVPVVGIDAPLTKAGRPSVLIDNSAAAQRATEHLIANGYQRIISVQVEPTLYTMKERQLGYERAMRDAGLTPETRHVPDATAAQALLRDHQDGRTRRAFLVGNELGARYMIGAAKQLSLSMPKDFAMVSFDDFELAGFLETPLTVISQPTTLIGEAAATKLFRHMLHGTAANSDSEGELETILEASLVIRGSSICRPSPHDSRRSTHT
ncbi:LacI family DNA-binding transcriptional regulator [Terriglobus aquaticus]